MRPHAYIIAVTGLLFLFTLFSGVRVSRNLQLNDPRPSGEPVSGVTSTVHKVISLLLVICAGVSIRNLHRGLEFRSVELIAVIVAGLLFLLMFVSGSLLSLGKARSDALLAVHQAGSLLTVIPASAAIYLLTRGRW